MKTFWQKEKMLITNIIKWTSWVEALLDHWVSGEYLHEYQICHGDDRSNVESG